MHDARAQRQEAAFASLAFADVDAGRGQVDVAQIEADELAAAHPGCVEQFEDRAVTQPQRIGHIGLSHQAAQFLTKERREPSGRQLPVA